MIQVSVYFITAVLLYQTRNSLRGRDALFSMMPGTW